MFYLKLILVIPAIIAVFIGCNGSKTSTKEKKEIIASHPYFPTAEGNTWKYVIEAPRDETELFTVKINKAEPKDRMIVLEVSSFPFFTKEDKPTTIILTSNGDIGVKSSSGTVDIFLPSEKLFSKDYNFTFGNWNGYVYSMNETVVTETGTYENCIGIGYAQSITFSANIWVAKNVGIVKWGLNRTNPPQLKQNYYVLKSVSLK